MRRKKVLLVDDSATTLMMERLMLSHTSYELLTARDGQEAIERALAERPDLILMDVIMPRLGGFEACKRMRTEEALRDTPILMVSTRGEPESRAMGFDSGCTDFVTKPLNSVELLAKLRSLLGE